MTIKVAMIADYPDSDHRIDGGVQAVTKYLVDAISAIAGVELTVIGFRQAILDIRVEENPKFVRYHIPYSSLGTLSGFAKDQKRLNACLATIRPDIVHSQGAGHFGILAQRTVYPTVITIHGILTQEAQYLDQLSRRLRTLLQGWMANFYCIRRATNTILISPYVKTYYGSKLRGRLYHIPNPIDEKFFNVARQESYGRIIFAGRLYALKGISDLISAVAKCSHRDQVKLIIAGPISDTSYEDELKRDVLRNDLTDQVEFRGPLRTDEFLAELSTCSCLVLPSYQETAPMVIQEAMAARVPVIASNICGIPYQIRDRKTGLLVTPGDTDQLANLLDELLGDPVLRERLSNAARQQAEEEFQAARIADKTVGVYREIIERSGLSASTGP